MSYASQSAQNDQQFPPVANPSQIDVNAMKTAIYNRETGNRPDIPNPYMYSKPSGDKTMGQDLGKYQVTSGELKTYSSRFLNGEQVKDKDFLNSRFLQEQYMNNKIKFLQGQGLSPEEIFASHAQGIPNWGDKKMLQQKIINANKNRSNYVSDSIHEYNKLAKFPQ